MAEALVRPVRVYRCTDCDSLGFGPVRPDNLFGYCRSCRLHRHFTLATDPEAQRWAVMRAPRPDPFYPTGTNW